MGNQLVGIAPTLIFPIEDYFVHIPDFKLEKRLGSTRFLKVASARSQEGVVVIKVFPIYDPTLPLASFISRVEEIGKILDLGPADNYLPFQKVLLNDGEKINEKAVYLFREFIKYSLYDRLSTRPFLLPLEKKWIAYQLLHALHRAHKRGVCHGDIKLENILITSWHWVLLTDFASFKPTFLPEDNPGDYSYFFDTSRRRICYIAPERFIKVVPSENSQQLILAAENSRKGDLNPAMDIFSAGCALAELFSDGHPPFDLSLLLAYRGHEKKAEADFEKYIQNKIEDESIREMLQTMMSRDPAERKSAETLLNEQRGKVFPEYFYDFLHLYIQMYSGRPPLLTSDEKIERIRKDINGGVIKEIEKFMKDEEKPCYDALVIILSLVTSCCRGLHLSNSKIQCLEVLLAIASYLPAEIILDRIIPYILFFVHDPVAKVKVAAIHTLTDCLSLESLANNNPASDINIFTEYILPRLNSVIRDEAVTVRTALAEEIAKLAEISLSFLDRSQVATFESNETPRHSYESELATLHEMIQQAVSALLTDPQNVVKRTLIESGITKLCIFFGKQKANDILLSHMITFLNDKEDINLRSSFFECIVGVATYIGIHSSPILTPLLQQGLTDPEELVIRKAINAMTALTELSLLNKSSLYELLEETACLLVHPNLWVRQAIVGFISALAKTLNIVDVQCKVMVVIEPYLKTNLIQLEKEFLILNSLEPPIPRKVYDIVAKSQDLELFIHTLMERQRARGYASIGLAPATLSISTSPKQNSDLRVLFNRLTSDGMTESVEDQLVAISRHIKKIQKYYAALAGRPAPDGKIDIGPLRGETKSHAFQFEQPEYDKTNPSGLSLTRKNPIDNSTIKSVNMNEEWKRMFSVDSNITQRSSSDNQNKISSTVLTSSPDVQASTLKTSEIDNSVQEKSFIQYRCAPCHFELRKLLNRKQEVYNKCVRTNEWIKHNNSLLQTPPSGWRLRGSLVAHLREDKGVISRLVTIPESRGLFASCSADGYIRLWDCVKMEGKNVANRSRQVYNTHAGPLTGLTCINNESLAAINDSGSVYVLNLEINSNKMTPFNSRQLDLQDDGTAVDIGYFNTGFSSAIVYATMYGSIIGWDPRTPGNAFQLNHNLKHGVITTMAIDSRQCCLSIGTSGGNIVCWDLRFHIPVSTICLNDKQRIRKLIPHPKKPSYLIASMQSNNEIGVWNIEGGTRELVLWPSPAPVFNTKYNTQSICGMYAAHITDKTFLITGGTDQRIRYWDLDSPCDSYLAVNGGNEIPGKTMFSYQSKIVDGTSVVQEIHQTRPSTIRSATSEDVPRAGPDPPAIGHQDTISDISICNASQCFLLTGSRDGVIKVWK